MPALPCQSNQGGCANIGEILEKLNYYKRGNSGQKTNTCS